MSASVVAETRQQAGWAGWKNQDQFMLAVISAPGTYSGQGERGSRHLDKPTRDPGGREMRKKEKKKDQKGGGDKKGEKD